MADLAEGAWRYKRVRTQPVLQMEPAESGAASLAMILGFYGRFAPLEEVRKECGVSRDGTRPSYILRAASKYGLIAQEHAGIQYRALKALPLPMIVFLGFTQFVVLEGAKKGKVYVNDPEIGHRALPEEEFEQSFSGIALSMEPGPEFRRGGHKPSVLWSLRSRLGGSGLALTYVVLAGLFLVVPGLVIPIFSKVFVDDILVGRMESWLGPLLTGMGLTAVLLAILTWLQKYYLLRLETRLALSTSVRFFQHVFRLPIDYFNHRFGGEVVSRVQINDRVAQLVTGELAGNMLNLLMIIFFAVLMLQYDVSLTLIGVFITLFNLAALRFFSKKRVNLIFKMLQDQGKSFGTAVNGLQMIETLKASGAESDFFAFWAGYQSRVKNAEQSLGVSSQLLATLPPFLSAMNGAVILCLGALKIMNGQMSMGSLIAFQSLMFSFVGPVNQLVNTGGQVQELRGDMGRLDDVLRNPVDRQFAGETAVLESAVPREAKLTGQVELRDLTFGYNTHEPPLIEDFSLYLKPGDRVALVGGSGSGKSTVARLVAGLYEPWSGGILLDGKPRGGIARSLLTNSLAVVDQEIFMFEGTVRENLTMWDSTIPEARIVQAAKDACIHDEIVSRAGAYDSWVAEGCSNYSGGQRQRLEIARALVNDPAVLILDEATSALDPITERIIDENLRRRGCTCIIIAHRLSTIRDCDEIVVLERGKVVQRGTHDEMRGMDGPYRRLIQSE